MKSGHPPSKSRADKLQFTYGVITVLLVIYVGVPSLWHCVKFGYDGIGMRIQHLWEQTLDWVGDDTFHLYVYGLNGWNIVSCTGRSDWPFYSWKCPPGPNGSIVMKY